MKLFQRLLVAPAALGLMAPVAVNADTAFSSTTTLSGEAVFSIGSADFENSTTNEELYMQYAYSLDLDSSFSGSDNLHVGIEAGNASGPMAVLDSAVASDADSPNSLAVSSLYYSFPVGDIAITGGPIVEADDLIGATVSTYSEGLVTQTLPYSSFDWTGPGVGAAYAPDNGITASASLIAIDGADSTRGINNDNSDEIATLSLGFNGEGGFGGGIVFTTSDGDNTTASTAAEYTTFGAGVYYNAQDMPLGVSVAFDTIDREDDTLESTSFHVGVDYEVGPGTAHVAYQTIDVDGSDILDQDIFEVGYSYDVNDNVTVTPSFYSEGETTGDDQDTGVVVETTFSF